MPISIGEILRSPVLDRQTERQHLRRLLGWAMGLSVPLIVSTLAAAFVLRRGLLAGAVLIHLGSLLGLGCARRLASRGRLEPAAMVLGYTLLVTLSVGAAFIRIGNETLIGVPMLAMALVLPHLRGRRLAVFAVAALLAEAELAVLVVLVPERPGLPPAWGAPLKIGAIMAIAVLAIVWLQQHSARLRRNLYRVKDAAMRAQQIYDSIPQLVFAARNDGTVEYVNTRFAEYAGSEVRLMGEDGWLSPVHPEGRSRASRAWREARGRGQPLELEVRLQAASGDASHWHLVRVIPLKDARGSITAWFGTLTDIDAQKRSAEALRFDAEASAVLGASLDLPITLDNLVRIAVPRLADFCIVHLHDESAGKASVAAVAHADPEKTPRIRAALEKFPLRPEEVPRMREVLRTGPELHPEVTDELLASMASSPAHLEAIRSAGMVSLMLIPLRIGGHPYGAMTLASIESRRRFDERDLSTACALADRTAQAVENAKLYQSAQQAVRARDDFLAIAGHELKTPLTSLHLQVRGLQRLAQRHPAGAVPAKKVGSRAEVIVRQVLRLESLIDTLLDVSRITRGRLKLQPEPLDLVRLVRESISRARVDLEHAGCEVRVDAPETVLGRWDRRRLEQVISNLLSNAEKFGAGAPIDIRVEVEAGWARLDVQDHGIGIAPEDQARIFECFERAVPYRHYGGFGLGLWIVHQVVEAMGGSIDVRSEPGKGARFTVELPLQPPSSWPLERGPAGSSSEVDVLH